MLLYCIAQFTSQFSEKLNINTDSIWTQKGCNKLISDSFKLDLLKWYWRLTNNSYQEINELANIQFHSYHNYIIM